MRKSLFLLFVLMLVGSSVHGETIIWQLGKLDNSAKEFGYPYSPWEYGRTPWIKNLHQFNPETHTFHYTIAQNAQIPAPAMVAGIGSAMYLYFMPKDEVVTGLVMDWHEEAAGLRKLSIKTESWRNQVEGKDGIDVTLPNRQLKEFHLPVGNSEKNGQKTFGVTFPVTKGQNEISIRVISLAFHRIMNAHNVKICFIVVTTNYFLHKA